MKESAINKPIFIISLDFELFWGVRDSRTIENYGQNILGVKQVVPSLLDLFKKYNVKATWATVGFLFARTKSELVEFLPKEKPGYVNQNLSPYQDFSKIGETEEEDPYHWGYSLLQLIKKYEGQEIASHTFSHYYCLEEGQTAQDFSADTQAALKIANKEGVELKSIVFPRNQLNRQYIHICEKYGFTNYRGNESSWIYKERNEEQQSLYKRGARLLDSYIDLSGHNTYKLSEIGLQFPYNIPASRFLRPYSPKLKMLDPLRLKRILSGMTHAARKQEVFHLWWHPHNFGSYLTENLSFLEQILRHFESLQREYGMLSMTMKEVADELMRKGND